MLAIIAQAALLPTAKRLYVATVRTNVQMLLFYQAALFTGYDIPEILIMRLSTEIYHEEPSASIHFQSECNKFGTW